MYAKSSTGWRRLLLDACRPELELCKYQVLPLSTGLGKTIPSHTEYISSSREGFAYPEVVADHKVSVKVIDEFKVPTGLQQLLNEPPRLLVRAKGKGDKGDKGEHSQH